MTLIESPLTDKEKQVFSHCRSVTEVTALSLSEEMGINYHSALKYLHVLRNKGYLSGRKKGKSWVFHVPRQVSSSTSLTIPYQGNHYTLEELLLYLSDNDDFAKYGKLISAACYHLAYRAAQINAGEKPDSPGPKEVAEFLHHAKIRYQELLTLVSILEELPLFDDNENTIATFGSVNERYLHEQVFNVFQPMWGKGRVSRHGLPNKFKETLAGLKQKFLENYGESRKVNE